MLRPRSRKGSPALKRYATPAAIVVVVLSLGAIAWLSLAWAHSVLTVRAPLAALRGDVVHLDEVLTMSARMHAATGEDSWRERYDAHVGLLDEELAGARALSIELLGEDLVELTNAANAKLVGMEVESFDLVAAGDLAGASRLLSSRAYFDAKREYAKGMDNLWDEMGLSSERQIRRVRASILAVAMISLAALGLILFMWRSLAQRVWIEQVAAGEQGVDQHAGKRRATLIACAVLLVGAGVTAAAVRRAHVESTELATARFEALAVGARDTIHRRASMIAQSIAGARGLFAASETVTRDEFRAYWAAKGSEAFDTITAVGSLELSPTGNHRTTHVVASAASGQVSVQDGVFVGEDFRSTIGRAQARGGAALELFDGRGIRPGTGRYFGLFVPLEDDSRTAGAASSMLFALIDPNELFDASAVSDMIDVVVREGVSDESGEARGPLVWSHEAGIEAADADSAGAVFQQQLGVDLGGESWPIEAASRPAFEASVGQRSVGLTTAVGVVITLLAAAWSWLLAVGRGRALAMASDITRRVRTLALVAERTHNVVIIADADRRITWVNDSFSRLTGYTLEEVVGKSPAMLQCERTDQDTVAELSEALRAGRGFGGQLLNVSKDGREYWVELDIQPLLGPDGEAQGYIAVEHDLTERIEYERALTEATAKAQRATEAKSRFLANMSHEIRTPLNGIIGFADLLMRNADKGDESERAEWIGIIHGSGTHLLNLLNDVLDMSKLDAGKMDVALAPCSPARVISEAVMIQQSAAAERGLTLSVVFEDGVPDAIRSDATRLRQIMLNLVGNAVKFTEVGAVKVIIGPATTGDGSPALRIRVADTGIGMTDEQLGRLFGVFEQAYATIADRFGGSGLGLAISKRIAERLGGDITATSTPGVGSVFTLIIAAPPLEAGESLRDELQARLPRSAGRSGAGQLAGVRVLVADDVDANRRVCELFLTEAGAEVVLAHDGVEAVNACMHAAFDVVLMDVQMPTLSGLQATRQLRDAGVGVPVIALTAYSGGADRERCEEAGMDDFLVKPFEPAALVQMCAVYAARAPKREPAPASLAMDDDETAFGDPVLRSVALSWLRELPTQLDEIERCHAQGDAEAVGKISHAIKGTGGTVGLPAFTSIGEALERADGGSISLVLVPGANAVRRDCSPSRGVGRYRFRRWVQGGLKLRGLAFPAASHATVRHVISCAHAAKRLLRQPVNHLPL